MLKKNIGTKFKSIKIAKLLLKKCNYSKFKVQAKHISYQKSKY